MKINTNSIQMHCVECDKESCIEWLSMFDKIFGRKKPRFCPWCGVELVAEKESNRADFDKEKK